MPRDATAAIGSVGAEAGTAPDPEPLLCRLVVLAVLAGGPDEEDADEHDAHSTDHDENDAERDVHALNVPASLVLMPRPM